MNLAQYSEDFGSWTNPGSKCTLTTNVEYSPAYPAPPTLTADKIDNTGDNTGYITITIQADSNINDRWFTFSVWLRGDTAHAQTIGMLSGTNAWNHLTLTTEWKRYEIQNVGSGGASTFSVRIYGARRNTSDGYVYAWGANVIENFEERTAGGVTGNLVGQYHPTANGIKLPEHHLTVTGAPESRKSFMQGHDGNRMQSTWLDGTNDYFSRTNHDSLDIFDNDFTITAVVKRDSGAGTQEIFTKYSNNNHGLRLYCTSGNWICDLHKSGSAAQLVHTVTTSDGIFHVIQVVRSSNTATLYFDGAAVDSVDATGFGIAGASNVYLLGDVGGTRFAGEMMYFRIDNEALSLNEIEQEYQKLLGYPMNHTLGWDWDRTDGAYQHYSDGTVEAVPDSFIRVGGDGGGVLIEEYMFNRATYSEDFTNWTQSGTCAVTANDAVAPDGETTADELDNTGGANTDYRYIDSGNLGSLTGEKWTASIWVRAATAHNVTLLLEEVAVANTEVVIRAIPEWQRIDVTRTMAGGGGGNNMRIRCYPGERGTATGVAHFWGGQLEEGTFPTSYIKTVASAVARNPDEISVEVSDIDTLPLEISDSSHYTKLTVEYEMKALFVGSADVDVSRSIFEISGNTGTAGTSRNRVLVLVTNGGVAGAYFYDDSSTVHNVTGAADPVDFSDWHHYKFYLDMSDLSNMFFEIDGSAQANKSGASGTATYDLTNCAIRPGMSFGGVVSADCKIRNLRILLTE
jgi:hypothetical protein